MSQAGVVELCPCIQLTFPEKICLMQQLSSLLHNTDGEFSSSQNCRTIESSSKSRRQSRFQVIKTETGRHNLFLGHTCTFRDHPLKVVIEIMIKAYLDDRGHLVVRTSYEITGSRPLPDPPDLGVYGGCLS
jgi:hypothetical protein